MLSGARLGEFSIFAPPCLFAAKRPIHRRFLIHGVQHRDPRRLVCALSTGGANEEERTAQDRHLRPPVQPHLPQSRWWILGNGERV